MKFTKTIKSLASWTFTIITPYNAPLVGTGGEQGMPLWIAILMLILNVAVIGIMIVAAVAWFVSNVA